MTDAQAWSPVVEQIRAGRNSAIEKLYTSLRSLRLFFGRQIGPDRAEDAYQSLILDLVVAIKRGSIRQPENLPAYAMTIARRKAALQIRELIRQRQAADAEQVVLTCKESDNPESILLQAERTAIAERVLKAMPPRDRDILVRFYLNSESAAEIRHAMGMTDTQFRLIKSRAKARYTALVQERLQGLRNGCKAA